MGRTEITLKRRFKKFLKKITLQRTTALIFVFVLLSLVLLRKFHLNPILVMAVSGALGAVIYSIPL